MSSTTVPVGPTVRSRRRRQAQARAFKYAALLFAAVIVLLPVYVLLVASFKGGAEADPSRAGRCRTWTLDGGRPGTETSTASFPI